MMKCEKAKKADLVLFSNVFTGKEEVPVKGGVAIGGNRILEVGSENEIEPYIGPETHVYQFDNGLIMPGFHDSHVHMIMGSLSQDSVSLHAASSEEEAAEMVFQFAKSRPNDLWVLGFSWYHVFWKNKVLPHKSSLDRLMPDRPVFLLNYEGHGAWINSKAMEICGIDRNTPDPPFGKIDRDENGEPTGYLYETAMGLVTKYAYDIPDDRQREVIKNFLAKAARLGVTSICDMQPFVGVDIGSLDVYREFETNGELTVRLHIATSLNGDMVRARYLRENYCSDKLMYSGFKEFLDGVATTYTAFMLEPYSDKPNSCGSPLISPEVIRNRVIEADREGFRVRLHACGDGAIRLGLDCVEAARNVNGTKDIRHTIEHIENIHPDDIKRFAQLGVVASMQPEHITITDSFTENPYRVRLGSDRERYTWALKTLVQNGAPMAFGSDYPVVDLDPIPGIYRAVTRLHNDGEPKGGWNPKERLTMSETLRAYTLGSAYAMYRENELGTLEKGKFADIIVLDRNLFEISHEEIRGTKVRLTVMDGKVVFELNPREY